ncbi:MAG: hypothetical protein K5869_10935 [Saccharofermentans sp.]|nr:hypothetical protein [Saccharofermentans sp.]
MNTAAVITAACFTAVSVLFFVYLLFTKNPLFSGKFRNYYRAGSAVYISGTILILILAFALKGVPVAFIVISEVMIMTVFIVTYILIANLSKAIANAATRNADVTVKEEKSDDKE